MNYSLQFTASNLPNEISTELDDWYKENKIKRFWAKDPTLWTNTDENNWMGWLDIASLQKDLSSITSLINTIKKFKDIVLLGMGGSSLFPAMLLGVFNKLATYPKFHVLDSTDPMQIQHLQKKIRLKETFFIVSSKSGNTLETNLFREYFFSCLYNLFPSEKIGNHFLAITDPGSSLESIAKKQFFQAIYYGTPSIGGRYSALSNFGLVPMVLMGIDFKKFLHYATEMQSLCRLENIPERNPGVFLGTILGVCAKLGKNKLTLVLSPSINSFGDWLEQLVAESTGKNGKGIIPINREPLSDAANYVNDRVFIYMHLVNDIDKKQASLVSRLEKAGHVVLKILLQDKMQLGAEIFRFEIATAVAASVLKVHPYNQPDVEKSKKLTLQFLEKQETTDPFPSQEISYDKNVKLIIHRAKNSKLDKLQNKITSENLINIFLNQIKKYDYFVIAAFIEMSDINNSLLEKIQKVILDHKQIATCLNFGPRFLHSTGQLYQGGPDNMIFLQITADCKTDIPLPKPYQSFGSVFSAQADANFTSLVERKKKILRVHLRDIETGLQTLHQIIYDALIKEA